tara:strand:+ start:1065 stop:1193 length:129 start_codon:yes stop_codon:yes gene_type:complete
MLGRFVEKNALHPKKKCDRALRIANTRKLPEPENEKCQAEGA